jgi:hypothetical protein
MDGEDTVPPWIDFRIDPRNRNQMNRRPVSPPRPVRAQKSREALASRLE